MGIYPVFPQSLVASGLEYCFCLQRGFEPALVTCGASQVPLEGKQML